MEIGFRVDKIHTDITSEGEQGRYELIPQGGNPKVSPKDWKITIKKEAADDIFGELQVDDFIFLEISKKNKQSKITGSG